MREETGFAVGDLTPLGHVIADGVERFVYHPRASGEVVPGEGVAYEWLSKLDDRPFVPVEDEAGVAAELLEEGALGPAVALAERVDGVDLTEVVGQPLGEYVTGQAEQLTLAVQ